jgi:hypothetical protein
MKKITVAIIGNNNHDMMKFSIETTLRNLPNYEDVLVVSNRPVIDYGQFVKISDQFGLADYNNFCLKELHKHIKTEFVLVIQHDGMAVNRNLWTDEFYNYDYIGPPWPNRFHWISEHERVGNGGFSLRSSQLLEALQDPNIKIGSGPRETNEDAVTCQAFGNYLRKNHNISFAPIELADKFGHEWNNPSGNTFGFHGVFNTPLYFDEPTVLRFLDSVPRPDNWYDDQLAYFVEICLSKNYTTVLSKVEDILYQTV